jgi:hypothetical protein
VAVQPDRDAHHDGRQNPDEDPASQRLSAGVGSGVDLVAVASEASSFGTSDDLRGEVFADQCKLAREFRTISLEKSTRSARLGLARQFRHADEQRFACVIDEDTVHAPVYRVRFAPHITEFHEAVDHAAQRDGCDLKLRGELHLVRPGLATHLVHQSGEGGRQVQALGALVELLAQQAYRVAQQWADFLLTRAADWVGFEGI